MEIDEFEHRKRDHLRHALDPSHQASGQGGLDRVRLVHEALPELDLADVRLEAPCLGAATPTPFYVAGMTAGHADARPINRALALACQARGWAMGVGSQRRDLEAPGTGSLDDWRALRTEAPRLTLFANIGLSQAISAAVDDVRRLVDQLGAAALVVHANALQEALQPEGTPRFRAGLTALEQLCKWLERPVVLKETGCGFSAATLKRVAGIGLAAVDVSGLGGTHWGRIEGARAGAESLQAAASRTFADWGEPTVDATLAAREALGDGTEIWASGGVRSGLDAAKLIALGAHRVGYAQPALEAALQGPERLSRWMETQEFELTVALFCTGNASPEALRARPGAWVPVRT
jgi:isopentenyl-diphosphate delta-isomerase